jgi:hypothetical protein
VWGIILLAHIGLKKQIGVPAPRLTTATPHTQPNNAPYLFRGCLILLIIQVFPSL